MRQIYDADVKKSFFTTDVRTALNQNVFTAILTPCLIANREGGYGEGVWCIYR